MSAEYSDIQCKLQGANHLESIRRRDAVYTRAKGLTSLNPKLAGTEIINGWTNLYKDLKAKHQLLLSKQKHRDNLKLIASKYENIKNAKILQLKEENLGRIKDVEIRKRKYQILKYQNYLNEEAIHLLWGLIVILLICCFIVLGNLAGVPYFDKSAVLGLVFAVLGIYSIYTIKKLLVDNVNINIYDIHQHNYKKPTEGELSRDMNLKDKIRSLRSQKQLSGQNNCVNPALETVELKSLSDDELQKVKDDMGTEDASQCLKLTMN